MPVVPRMKGSVMVECKVLVALCDILSTGTEHLSNRCN